MNTTPQRPKCQQPVSDTRQPCIRVPSKSCDTHAHIFGSLEKYPLSPQRGYEPPEAGLEQYLRLHHCLGIERGVLVQPSAYGTDNTLITDTLKHAGNKFRAVIAVKPEISDRTLQELHDAGVRGVRINLVDPGGNPFATFGEIRQMAQRIKHLGWHMEFLAHVHTLDDLRATFDSIPVDMVFGHLGFVPANAGIQHPGFQEFLAMARDGRIWIKLTAPNRLSAREEPPYDDVDVFGQALIEAAPDRVIWGSDWPHVFFFKSMPNDGDLLDQLATWATDEKSLQSILVDNPARLYGFHD